MKLLRRFFGCCVFLMLLAWGNVEPLKGLKVEHAPSLNGLLRIDKYEYFAPHKPSVTLMPFEEMTAEHLTLLAKKVKAVAKLKVDTTFISDWYPANDKVAIGSLLTTVPISI